MGLRDELDPVKTNGAECSVRTFVEAQPDPAEWIELLDDPSIQSSRVWRLMRKYGYPFSDQSVGRHRNGGCKCGRPAK